MGKPNSVAMALKRPVSPFLSVYKLQRGSFFSIFSRITGVLLFLLFLLIVSLFLFYPSFSSFYSFYFLFYSIIVGGYGKVSSFSILLLLVSVYYHLVVAIRYYFLANPRFTLALGDPFLLAGSYTAQFTALFSVLPAFLTFFYI